MTKPKAPNGPSGGSSSPGPSPAPSVAPSLAPGKPCPICGKPAAEATRPFCSERCKDVDLNRWLSGAYVVPGKSEEDEDGGGSSGEGGTER